MKALVKLLTLSNVCLYAAFRVHFPCYEEIDGHTGRFTVKFEFYRGRRRRRSLLEPGSIVLMLNRKCPPSKQIGPWLWLCVCVCQCCQNNPNISTCTTLPSFPWLTLYWYIYSTLRRLEDCSRGFTPKWDVGVWRKVQRENENCLLCRLWLVFLPFRKSREHWI